jgi:hypothetical protein
MVSPPTGSRQPTWHYRAASVGFYVLDGKDVASMDEQEIAEAFDKLSLRHGISYVWKR